jgi:hypothetical protein
MATDDQNSKRTRVEPVFDWLREHGGRDWPSQLLAQVHGLAVPVDCGPLVSLDYEREVRVAPSARRLAWMIRNAERLAPADGRKWREYQRRVIENPGREDALDRLDRGESQGIGRDLILEGKTAADCLIECEKAVIWVEGKRNDWLSCSTSWDLTRDQLARNTEAAWLHARRKDKESCLIVCHEHPLKYHEELLIDGYRRGTWSGGWPHLTPELRETLGARIGTVTWTTLSQAWPELAEKLR